MKLVCKYCCEKCANRDVVVIKGFSVIRGEVDDSYCANGKEVIMENHAKHEIEIYCENYKEKNNE